jgi:hypothetical protein
MGEISSMSKVLPLVLRHRLEHHVQPPFHIRSARLAFQIRLILHRLAENNLRVVDGARNIVSSAHQRPVLTGLAVDILSKVWFECSGLLQSKQHLQEKGLRRI